MDPLKGVAVHHLQVPLIAVERVVEGGSCPADAGMMCREGAQGRQHQRDGIDTLHSRTQPAAALVHPMKSKQPSGSEGPHCSPRCELGGGRGANEKSVLLAAFVSDKSSHFRGL